MCWRIILKEYGPELQYIKGEANVVADALSRLDMLADHPVSEEEVAEMFAADAQTFMKAFPRSYEDIAQRQTTDVFIHKALRTNMKGYEKTVCLSLR